MPRDDKLKGEVDMAEKKDSKDLAPDATQVAPGSVKERGEPVPYIPYWEQPQYEEVSLIQYVNVLLKRRWMIAAGVFLCVVLTGIISKKIPPTFTASAKFLPSKNPEMISRMGELIGGGEIKSFEQNVTSEYYSELMKSSIFLERIINRKFLSKRFGGEVDLATYHKIEAGSDAEKLLKTIRAVNSNLKVSVARTTQVVSLSYSTRERELSAAIVNAFLDELITYNQTIRDTKSSQNRKFIEGQLADAQDLLKKAEAALADFSERNRQIATPDLEAERDRLKRNVKVQEEIYITLKKQLELAKIEEQEKRPSIEIIERAAPPLTKSKPRTKMNVILAAFVSFFLFCGLAFVMEWVGRMSPDTEPNREFLRQVDDIKRDFGRVTKVFRRRKKKF